MIILSFLKEEIEELRTLSVTHPHHFVRRKALVLLLKSARLPHHQIATIVGICENTVRYYLYMYLQSRIKFITTIEFYKPQSELKPFDEVITNYLNESPPSTIKQACAEIAALTGVHKKETQMRCYLKNRGATYRKVGSIPAKANIDAQQKFHDNKLQPRLEEAKMNKRSVYFMDAAHFVLGAFLGRLWSLARVFVRTPSGRQRFNVLGALNAVTKELLTITNESYITSIQVCELLRLIAVTATLPVTLILDNARYQRCHLVIGLAEELGIELLFLPPYSPNLNLIERLWKLTKKQCLNSKYYSDFSRFRQAIHQFLKTAHQNHEKELQSLLTFNFQMFTEEQVKLAA